MKKTNNDFMHEDDKERKKILASQEIKMLDLGNIHISEDAFYYIFSKIHFGVEKDEKNISLKQLKEFYGENFIKDKTQCTILGTQLFGSFIKIFVKYLFSLSFPTGD